MVVGRLGHSGQHARHHVAKVRSVDRGHVQTLFPRVEVRSVREMNFKGLLVLQSVQVMNI